jgi:DNA-directed RNA polymerase specialized sigma24 family protein
MDRSVVEAARGGDRDAFASLVGQVSDSLYAVAFRILRETGAAEDALQNALIATWQQLPHLRDAERFEAWSQRILVHACYAEFRRRRQFATNVHLIDSHGTSDGSRVLADRDEIRRTCSLTQAATSISRKRRRSPSDGSTITGRITTVTKIGSVPITPAQVPTFNGWVFDAAGDLYVSTGSAVLKFDANGQMTVIAGVH